MTGLGLLDPLATAQGSDTHDKSLQHLVKLIVQSHVI
jgi:hypothetical protein